MDAGDLGLYKLRFEQMDAVRSAHRDARRFHVALNITGFSSVLGFLAEFGDASAAIVGAASAALAMMCVVWFSTSSYYAKSIALKAQSVLELETRLGLSYLKDELRVLDGGAKAPSFPLDRLSALVLGAAYCAVAAVSLSAAANDQGGLAALVERLMSMAPGR